MDNDFQVQATHAGDYRFMIDFHLPGVPDLLADEPPPLGAGAGPNPARLLAGAVANCLAASLFFCLQKRRVVVDGIQASAEGTIVRNARGRYRIHELRVRLDPDLPHDGNNALERCKEIFEDFCIVTESVRDGITVQVEVSPRDRVTVSPGVSGEAGVGAVRLTEAARDTREE